MPDDKGFSLLAALLHRNASVTYNTLMDKDETLEEFVQILGRIQKLIEDETTADGNGLDLVEAINQLRQSGKDEIADELAGLVERADELKTLQQANQGQIERP